MASSRKFQSPRGTRDFYPADMAVRRYIESVWRTTSINHGFEEVEGPTIEHLDLYTHKSGPGIVNELFQVYSGKDEQQIAAIRSGEDAPYALRPEFTPTLARMVAARATQLPKPIKWFAIPGHYRAERPQRGRLREFFQWNVDFIGDESPSSDVEILACCVEALRTFGLTPNDVKIRYSDREIVSAMLVDAIGIAPEATSDWLVWMDKYDKLDPQSRLEEAARFGGTEQQVRDVEDLWSGKDPDVQAAARSQLITEGKTQVLDDVQDAGEQSVAEHLRPSQRRMKEFENRLHSVGISDWCSFDPKIVRGLAYYTGLVFEIHEAMGEERAVAGGGRYDKLIESFGGPSMPACGFGMGDVVLGLLLHEKGLLPEEVYMAPLRPHVFVIAANDDAAEQVPPLVAKLRSAGLHVRHSYRSTRNVGKLLGEAGKQRAHTAVILGEELAAGRVALKDLDGGEQRDVPLSDLQQELQAVLDAHDRATSRP